MTTDPRRTVSDTELRHAMRQLPSPVTVVTTALGCEMRGITIGSFTSVSLDPALVSLNLSVETPMLRLVERAMRFVVHFLRDDQVVLSEIFAQPNVSGVEQFDRVTFRKDDDGLPLIAGVLCRLYCSVESMYAAGDHVLVVASVYRIEELESGNPLVYFDRGYRSVGGSVHSVVRSNTRESSTGTS